MDRTILQPLSGFRDYSGKNKDRLIFCLRQIFLAFGYQPLETPSIEKQELLLKDYGEDAQKLLYLFEDNGKRKVGLRYDLTVPLARFVALNWQELPMPYKRFEIGTSWRAERAQKGRLRQFTQADIDIVGVDSTQAELELIEVIAELIKQTGLSIKLQLNDRRIVGELLEKLKIDSQAQRSLLRVLDKKDKLTDSELIGELNKVGLTDVTLGKVRRVFLEDNNLEEVSKMVGSELTASLSQLIADAKELGLTAEFTPSMVRGLDYYTGTIFECVVEGYPSSIAAGGRYDSLIEEMTGKKVPAVGLSFGVDRLADILDEKDDQPADTTFFVAALPETYEAVRDWTRRLREQGRNVELYLDKQTELGKQIKYADKKGYAEIYIPLPEEWKKGKIIRKNLSDGSQQSVAVTSLEKDDSI